MTAPRRVHRARFTPPGNLPLALAPQALGLFFDMDPAPQNDVRDDGTAIIAIRGPLMSHEDWCFDSYDGIKARVVEALEAGAKNLVLSIDSPGGMLNGCFDTCSEIRALAAAKNVPVYAFVDGMAASAGYALACAASHITIPSTGIAGSIGVINALVDATAQDAMWGVKLEFVASGARKTDGNPHVPISDGARAAMRSQVMELAEMFFAHVAEHRSVSVDEIRALEAGLRTGASAVSDGLADQVATLDELLAQIAGGQVPAAGAAEGEQMGTEAKSSTGKPGASKAYEDAIAALRKCAQGDDDEAAKAKKMLAAELDDGGEKKDDAEPEKKDEAKAEDAPAKKDEPDGDEAKALAARVDRIEATQAAQAKAQADAAVASERAALLATRTDLEPTVLAMLAEAPIASVRTFVKDHPRALPRRLAAAASVAGTRGEGQGTGTAARQDPAAKAQMDAAMGLAEVKTGAVVDEGNKLILGATLPSGKVA